MAGVVSAYERGSQAVFFPAATGAAGDQQVAAGGAAPVNANVFGLVATVSRGQQPWNFLFQVEPSTGSATWTIDILGSLDGVHFFPLNDPTAHITSATTPNNTANGALLSLEQFAKGTNDPTVRFITVAVISVSAGTLKVSFTA